MCDTPLVILHIVKDESRDAIHGWMTGVDW
jgi:hypothetical protein